ncbi:hypothetical protein VNO77_24641 [Canavalia gladiata]|uniref:Uncharacterized protein n=1 Tax=Canavalia gladiata TaxID=3824 RepID=A0AAN9L6N4_CANGL
MVGAGFGYDASYFALGVYGPRFLRTRILQNADSNLSAETQRCSTCLVIKEDCFSSSASNLCDPPSSSLSGIDGTSFRRKDAIQFKREITPGTEARNCHWLRRRTTINLAIFPDLVPKFSNSPLNSLEYVPHICD